MDRILLLGALPMVGAGLLEWAVRAFVFFVAPWRTLHRVLGFVMAI